MLTDLNIIQIIFERYSNLNLNFTSDKYVRIVINYVLICNCFDGRFFHPSLKENAGHCMFVACRLIAGLLDLLAILRFAKDAVGKKKENEREEWFTLSRWRNWVDEPLIYSEDTRIKNTHTHTHTCTQRKRETHFSSGVSAS